MTPPDLDRLLGLDTLSTGEADKVFKYLVRILRNRNVARYIKSHQAAYDEFITAVQEIPCANSPPTPVSTSHIDDNDAADTSETAAAPLPHGVPHSDERDADEQADSQSGLFVEQHDHSSPIAPRCNADSPSPLADAEETSIVFQRSADIYEFDVRDSPRAGQSLEQTAIPHRPCKAPYGSKHRRNFKDRASKRLRIIPRDKSQDSARHNPRDTPDPPERFSDLAADLREKAQRIKGVEALWNAWHFCRCLRGPTSPYSHEASTDSLDRLERPVHSINSDLRLSQLRYLIGNWTLLEKSLRASQLVARVSKRVHLVELVGRFVEERGARKAVAKRKRRGPSTNEKFTDLLFPETIVRKPKLSRADNKEKGDNPRERAKRTLEYWIWLGEPLLAMAQRFGIGILLLLLEDLTDADLHGLLRCQIETFLDYIDSCHPGLKEQISNLSALLPGIIDHGLPPQQLVLETLPPSQLSDRSLDELFQLSSAGLEYSPKEAFHSSSTNNIEAGILVGNLSGSVLQPPQTLWAGGCEFDLSIDAINARDKLERLVERNIFDNNT